MPPIHRNSMRSLWRGLDGENVEFGVLVTDLPGFLG
jgi:hypothetical protein